MSVSVDHVVNVAILEASRSGKRELHLRGTPYDQLTEIPEAVCHLTDLRILNIGGGYSESRTKITRIPKEIARLKSLEVLVLEKNQISELPEELFQLVNLQQLYLRDNNLTDLPSSIASLKSLIRLDVSRNHLKELPSEIGALSQLDSLNVEENPLTLLPLEIGRLDNLKRLKVGEIEVQNIPLEILKQSPGAIVNYCKSVLDERVVYLFEAKLLVVGEGGSGKTCLVRRIARDSFIESPTTEGIDVETWNTRTEQIAQFRVNIWDFGGQEIYHATHQFFLTKRSLYLFVWTARTDQTNFDYWLNVVRLLSNNSPVIIVLNKTDERIKMLDEAFIKQRFENVVAFHRVSALTGDGIANLITTIKHEITSLEHVGNTLPKVWVEIRSKLEALAKNYIDYSEYKAICAQCGLDKTKVDFLSLYYHDLGVFLHFQENPVLKGIVFLKPEWATGAVYRIVDTKSVIESFGKFDFDQLATIWSEYPEDRHLHLVELMKKFELCFQIPETKTYIIPELLQPSAPPLEWSYANNLRFEYHYDFMPSGIITRFMVLNHHLMREDSYWKSGAIFERENTSALITSDPFNRKIQLWIDGPQQKEMLSILREKMDYIHKTLNQPAVREMLQCVCEQCENGHDPFFYEYEILKRFYYRGRKTIPCSRSAEDVSIERMLGGIERTSVSAEDEILRILRNIQTNYDDEESLLRKANEIIELRPSFMGLGINVNQIISRFLKKDKRRPKKSEEPEILSLPPYIP